MSVAHQEIVHWVNTYPEKAAARIQELEAQRDSAIESNIAISKMLASGDPESGTIRLLYGQPLVYWLRMEDQRVELLDALEGVVNEYDKEDNGRSLRWEIDIALAVIAKVKGEQL